MRNNLIKLLKNKEVFFVHRGASSFQRIADLLTNNRNENNSTSIKGWVKSVRKMKENVFIDVDDGSCGKRLQVVLGKALADNLDYGCSIEAKGKLDEAPSGQLELKAENVQVIGHGHLQDGYPFAPRKTYSSDYYRQYLHLRPRILQYASMLRVRNSVCIAFREFFKKKNYIEIHTPILTSNDSEGAGEVFKINGDISSNEKKNEPFFDIETFLTVSAQLHLEIVARSLSQVYCFGPTFRAENSKSRFHLAEFYMLEAETTLINSTDDLISFTEELLRSVIIGTIENCESDIVQCRKRFSEMDFKLEKCLEKPWTVMDYEEAAAILAKHCTSLKGKHQPETSFTKEHELFLTNHNGGFPIFIKDFPTNIKPFYMKLNKYDVKKVEAFDLLFPNVGEICGGSLREDDIKRLGLSLENHKGLEWYLELRKFGNVLTGGFGIGFDRFLMALLNINNIKDTVPFPRYPHHCQL